jgi:predicted PurR-regulated permease PerM
MANESSSQRFTPFFSPSQISAKTVIWAIGTSLVLLLAVWVASRAGFSILLTLASLLVAIAIDHAVQWLTLRRWNRSVAIAATMAALVLILIAFAVAFVPAAIHQGIALASNLPSFVRQLHSSQTYSALNKQLRLDENLTRLVTPSEGSSKVASEVVAVLSNAALVVGGGLTVFVLALFMLVFGPALIERLLDEVRQTRRPYYARIFQRIYTSLGGYIGGQAVMSGTIAILVSLFLAIIRVPFFLPLGILCGLVNPIPNIGAAISVVVVALCTFASGGIWKTVAFIVFFIVYKQVENQVVGPLVFKRTASVNPLVGTVVVLFATELAGVPGALLAIPSLAAVQVVLGEILAIRREWLQRAAPEDAPRPARLPESRRAT